MRDERNEEMNKKQSKKSAIKNETRKANEAPAAKYGRPGTIKNVVIDLFQKDAGIGNEGMVAAVKAKLFFPFPAARIVHSVYRQNSQLSFCL